MDTNNKITIKVSNRTGKKLQTFLYGLGQEFDLEKIIKHFKKTFSCTGSIEKSEEFGEVIKLTGDQRKKVFDFLISEDICSKSDIMLKGL
jgi:translation initiation factor 1